MDVLLLLSKKKIPLDTKGKGDYSKLDFSCAPKLTTKNNKLSEKYVFTGWQIINKKFYVTFQKKLFH